MVSIWEIQNSKHKLISLGSTEAKLQINSISPHQYFTLEQDDLKAACLSSRSGERNTTFTFQKCYKTLLAIRDQWRHSCFPRDTSIPLSLLGKQQEGQCSALAHLAATSAGGKQHQRVPELRMQTAASTTLNPARSAQRRIINEKFLCVPQPALVTLQWPFNLCVLDPPQTTQHVSCPLAIYCL